MPNNSVNRDPHPDDLVQYLETVDGQEVVTGEIKGDELKDLLANSERPSEEEIQKLIDDMDIQKVGEPDVAKLDGEEWTPINVHSGEEMDGEDGTADFFIAEADGESTISDFNVEEDFVSVTSDTFTFEDVESRVDDKGLHLSWDGGSIFLEGVTEAPTAEDSWFQVTDPADLTDVELTVSYAEGDFAEFKEGDTAGDFSGEIQLSMSEDGGVTWQDVSPDDYM